MTTPTPYTEVTITWTEEWRRSATTRLNLADVREWASLDADHPIDQHLLTEYFANSHNDFPQDDTWYPNTYPDNINGDEFIDLIIDHVVPTSVQEETFS